jgi:hypothetical protein
VHQRRTNPKLDVEIDALDNRLITDSAPGGKFRRGFILQERNLRASRRGVLNLITREIDSSHHRNVAGHYVSPRTADQIHRLTAKAARHRPQTGCTMRELGQAFAIDRPAAVVSSPGARPWPAREAIFPELLLKKAVHDSVQMNSMAIRFVRERRERRGAEIAEKHAS